MELVKEWYRRYFSNPQVVILALLLLSGFFLVIFFSRILLPVFVAIVLAYLFEGVVRQLQRVGIPRLASVMIVFFVFMLLMAMTVLGLLPQLSRQVTLLFQQMPGIIDRAEQLLLELPERYPTMFSETQVIQWADRIQVEITQFGTQLLTRTLSSVVGIITVIVYVILVPILVFFMMKDKEKILAWFSDMMPRDRALAANVWVEVDRQIGNYIRGKFWEILIVWAAAYVLFAWFGLQFSVLLSFLVGVAVIVPWVGTVIITFPVMFIAYSQFGFGSEFMWLFAAYFILQTLDANVLVPLLYSEVVDLHPIAIIVAVLFFGGIWGFWGVFFSIPLATLVQAVFKAWPDADAMPIFTGYPGSNPRD